ncbi:MAG: alpha/beta hydrolase [Verrucomicrobiota bacterium]|jgi:fermentation-respiration switch protein FrsA (DUF1100 family)
MMKARRTWLGLAILGLCVLAIFLMLRRFEQNMVYQPSRQLDAAPGELGRPCEDVFILVAGDERIAAWYFPAATKGAPVLLVCHGNAGNISHRLDLCAVLLEAGAGVLLFDYRGYGRSDGKPDEEGTYRDAQAAYHWLREKGLAGTNILAYGESLGGGVASELALREPLGGLILQSTFTSVPDLGAELFPWLPVRLIGRIRYDTRRKLPRLTIPILILHSPQDDLIPFAHAEKNFAAAHDPKFLCELSGRHNDGPWPSRPIILRAVREFLQTHAVKQIHTESEPAR